MYEIPTQIVICLVSNHAYGDDDDEVDDGDGDDGNGDYYDDDDGDNGRENCK